MSKDDSRFVRNSQFCLHFDIVQGVCKLLRLKSARLPVEFLNPCKGSHLKVITVNFVMYGNVALATIILWSVVECRSLRM